MDLNEYRAKKEGKVTVKECLKDLIDNLEDIDAVVFVAKKKDGRILTGWSDVNHTEVIGMLHVSQSEVMNDMYE